MLTTHQRARVEDFTMLLPLVYHKNKEGNTLIKDFKEALEKELGCTVTIEVNVFSSDLRSNEEAIVVAQKLEKMICEIETDVQTDTCSSDDSQWFDIHKKDSRMGSSAVVFLPYPVLEEQAI